MNFAAFSKVQAYLNRLPQDVLGGMLANRSLRSDTTESRAIRQQILLAMHPHWDAQREDKWFLLPEMN